MVFLGDIAFYMAALVLAAGIYMIHHANHHDKDVPCRLLKFGGYVVTVISLLGMLCTGYYWMKYFNQGAYDKPYSRQRSMMMKGGMNKTGMMGNMQGCMGNMEGKVMDPAMMKKMRSCMMHKGMPSVESDSENEHEGHH